MAFVQIPFLKIVFQINENILGFPKDDKMSNIL